VIFLISFLQRLGEESRNLHPEVPWSSIIAMRNRLIHVYFDVNLDRVWDTITDDLPPLIAILETVMSKEKEI